MYIGKDDSAPEMLYFILNSFSTTNAQLEYAFSSQYVTSSTTGKSVTKTWLTVIDNYSTIGTELDDTDERFGLDQPRPIMFNVTQCVKAYKTRLSELEDRFFQLSN